MKNYDITIAVNKSFSTLFPFSNRFRVDRRRYAFSLKTILSIKNINKKKILDIGTGIGILPLALKFLDIQASGLDYYVFPENNNQMFQVDDIKNLNTIWSKHNIDIVNKNFFDNDLPWKEQNFDIIVSEATIEHLQNPKQFLDKCYSLLKPGGYLLLSTPNLSTLLKRIRFLFGLSPSWPIDDFYAAGEKFTGHWREYTMNELSIMCKKSNFKTIKTYNINLLANFKRLRAWKKNIRAFITLISYLIPGSREMNYILCKKQS